MAQPGQSQYALRLRGKCLICDETDTALRELEPYAFNMGTLVGMQMHVMIEHGITRDELKTGIMRAIPPDQSSVTIRMLKSEFIHTVTHATDIAMHSDDLDSMLVTQSVALDTVPLDTKIHDLNLHLSALNEKPIEKFVFAVSDFRLIFVLAYTVPA